MQEVWEYFHLRPNSIRCDPASRATKDQFAATGLRRVARTEANMLPVRGLFVQLGGKGFKGFARIC